MQNSTRNESQDLLMPKVVLVLLLKWKPYHCEKWEHLLKFIYIL